MKGKSFCGMVAARVFFDETGKRCRVEYQLIGNETCANLAILKAVEKLWTADFEPYDDNEWRDRYIEQLRSVRRKGLDLPDMPALFFGSENGITEKIEEDLWKVSDTDIS